jgi:oxygen-independent coproporphyrinogen-3 oxidase
LTKCEYCGFYSVTSLDDIPNFLGALFKEMEMYRRAWGPVDTVYLGGGTPSVLSREHLAALLEKTRKNFMLLPNAEITLEANPGDLDLSFLRFLREIGINRLNIGVQSFDQRILGFLGRRHSPREALSSLENSRKAGFENIGVDLIYGIPGQEIDSWLETLSQTLAWSPEHLSCYELTLEHESPLERRYRMGDFLLPGEDLQYEFFVRTAEMAENNGYTHYEVSNFAKGMTFASRHNQKYWDHTPYLGLGPGAHSFAENRRWWNLRSVSRYVKEIRAGSYPVEGNEALTLEQLRLEALFLGLRTKGGINLHDFAMQYEYDLAGKKGALIERFQKEGFISIQKGILAPTRRGLALADHLALLTP